MTSQIKKMNSKRKIKNESIEFNLDDYLNDDILNNKNEFHNEYESNCSSYDNDTHDYNTNGVNLDYGNIKSDSYEGQSAKTTLLTMSKDLYDLYTSLSDQDDLPEWCHYKLATSKKDLSDVTDYLTSKILKHCIENNISESNLKKHIKNSLIKKKLNEGLGDLYGKFKGLFNKKSNSLNLNFDSILEKSKIESAYSDGYVGKHISRFIKIIKNVITLNSCITFLITKTSNEYNEETIATIAQTRSSLLMLKNYLDSNKLNESKKINETYNNDEWNQSVKDSLYKLETSCKEIISLTNINQINRINYVFDNKRVYPNARIILSPINRLLNNVINEIDNLLSTQQSKNTVPVIRKQTQNKKTEKIFTPDTSKTVKIQNQKHTLQGYPASRNSNIDIINRFGNAKNNIKDEVYKKHIHYFISMFNNLNNLNKKAKISLSEDDTDAINIRASSTLRYLNKLKDLIQINSLTESKKYFNKNKLLKEIEGFEVKSKENVESFKDSCDSIEKFVSSSKIEIFFSNLRKILNVLNDKDLNIILPVFYNLLNNTIENLTQISSKTLIRKK